VGTGPGLVPVAEAARHFGITERAVRKRIVAGTLHGVMIDRAWHVSITEPSEEPEQGRSSGGSRNRNSSGPVPLAPVPVQTQMHVLMQEWIAPLAARIEALAGENGELRADLRHEQERREVIERERDELRARLAATEDNPPMQSAPVAPVPSQREPEVFPKQRWPWWMRILAGR